MEAGKNLIFDHLYIIYVLCLFICFLVRAPIMGVIVMAGEVTRLGGSQKSKPTLSQRV